MLASILRCAFSRDICALPSGDMSMPLSSSHPSLTPPTLKQQPIERSPSEAVDLSAIERTAECRIFLIDASNSMKTMLKRAPQIATVREGLTRFC